MKSLFFVNAFFFFSLSLSNIYIYLYVYIYMLYCIQICILSRIRRVFSLCTRRAEAFDESSDGVVRSEGLTQT